MFSEWQTEETPEQKIRSVYKEKIKKLGDPASSFNGELVNIPIFREIINNANDPELTTLCSQMYPHIFVQSDNLLITKNLIISAMQFTSHQATACDKFIEFMTTPGKKTFGLYGFSGTGKTTTIVEIVSSLLKSKLIKSVAFSAPTNKAVNVMKNKFENAVRDIYTAYVPPAAEILPADDLIHKLHDYGINIEFTTVHRLLNFETDFDSNGKMIFRKNNGCELWKYEIVIIDECSMLAAQMVDSIFSDIRADTRNIKIIFTGDTAQLPPVNEKNSIIFSKSIDDFPINSFLECLGCIVNDKEQNVFNTIKINNTKKKYDLLMQELIAMDHFVMEQVVRSKSNNVLGVCTKIREWTLSGSDGYKIKKFLGQDCVAYRYNGKSKTQTDWFEHFLQECRSSKDSIILTWTNKQCNEYNDAIRKYLFGTDKTERFLVGDILMLGDYYNMKETKTEENKFYTSEQIKVVGIEIGPKTLESYPPTISKKAQKLEHAVTYGNVYKKTIEKIGPAKCYKCWKLTVKRLSCESNNTSILYVIHEDDLAKYKVDVDLANSIVREMRNGLVSKFREKMQTIDNNIMRELWKNTHSVYSEPFANVNYGYCITSHKAQGSTFYNVYVDMNDIIKNGNSNEMRRCLYTAVSRTSNELHLMI